MRDRDLGSPLAQLTISPSRSTVMCSCEWSAGMSAAMVGLKCWSWTTIRRPGHAAAHAAEGRSTVAEAANGSEAIEALERAKPALILLDLMMPGMDGFEVLETARR